MTATGLADRIALSVSRKISDCACKGVLAEIGRIDNGWWPVVEGNIRKVTEFQRLSKSMVVPLGQWDYKLRSYPSDI